MSDTFITIMVVFIAVVALFIVPVMATANQNDKITQTSVQTIVTEFVNTSAREGKITEENYDDFIQKLHATGNTYSVELEVQVLDDNPGKKGENKNVIGENIYYSVFKNDIESKIKSDHAYYLKKGDYVKAKVQNSNVTFGTQFKNFLYSIMGKDTIAIEASSSALVTTTGKEVARATIPTTPETPETPTEPVSSKKKILVKTKKKVKGDLDIVVVLDCESATIPTHNNEDNIFNDENFVTTKSILLSIKGAVVNSGKGNVSFILTCYPNQVITDLDNLDWRFSAFSDFSATHYAQSMETAVNLLKDKDGTKYIVFLSYMPGYESAFKDAINVLKKNTSYYTNFYTTSCCKDNRGHEGDGSPFDYTIWKKTGKYGGNIFEGNAGGTFIKIANSANTGEVIKTISSKTVESDENLKVKLDKYVPNQEIKPSLAVDGTLYDVGDTISSDIIYFDRDQSSYVLDLKKVKDLLSITDEKWKSTEMQIEYLITN